MNLTFLDRKRNQRPANGLVIEEDGNTLRLVDRSIPASTGRSWEPRIIRGGEQCMTESSTGGSVTARAEIHAKRFFGNSVDEDRYSATISATDGSPHALLAALSRAFGEVDEFRASRGTEERVILQLSLIL